MSTSQFSIAALNAMTPQEFTDALGAIFEHSPWVAERAAAQRPFTGVPQLHQAMADVVRQASEEERLRLIRAHPELAGKAAVRGELTEESTREQKGAGLDQCSTEEFAQLQALNRRYNEKFGFPFVIAVKGHNRQSILQHFARRLENERDVEARECIEQIIRIGGFRLTDVVK
ncbi:MAG TPA: 2-oxo-4-hydroxy-4-carboxy-5-ureidoimidazoline decarboxylase [Noviherbaspirillum sp.]|uniref:2-oxo-4-hydroxy-4-carboxy-5-ureidoimidazoline decarboxylase n=1 Tax=Noviherbaspirillum sp. TaxID=1926288 RepID=UPI002B489E91|nr:2-oxo-4-hydroxy-4-carboxy-5-ureidoimidazoline decarboxylase [Noviherbaspirillum sp.]HJV84127.1 2-oxo-4-hydroxy-4-carboxy-5-ureidoimidazoline decarboxylase [Noviherbaspirillum sp.]